MYLIDLLGDELLKIICIECGTDKELYEDKLSCNFYCLECAKKEVIDE